MEAGIVGVSGVSALIRVAMEYRLGQGRVQNRRQLMEDSRVWERVSARSPVSSRIALVRRKLSNR